MQFSDDRFMRKQDTRVLSMVSLSASGSNNKLSKAE